MRMWSPIANNVRRVTYTPGADPNTSSPFGHHRDPSGEGNIDHASFSMKLTVNSPGKIPIKIRIISNNECMRSPDSESVEHSVAVCVHILYF